MDIVSALNHYRKTISSDEAAFEVLFFLYKDGSTSEEDIRSSTGIDARVLKEKLRELYQANLVRSKAPGCFILTSLGDDVCSRFGADKVVITFLLDELLDGKERSGFDMLIEWAFSVEPERARLTAQSLRNLKIFLSYSNETSARQRRSLALTCMTPPNSSRRYLLQNLEVAPEFILHFSGHGVPADETEWKTIIHDYRNVAALYDQMDLVLINACHSASSPLELSEEALSHLSFRLFNYINSEGRDYTIESCVANMTSDKKKRVFATFLKRLPRGLASLSRAGRAPVEKSSSDQLYTLAKRAVAKKAKWEARESPVSSIAINSVTAEKPETSDVADVIRSLEEYLRTYLARARHWPDAAPVEDLRRARLLLKRLEQSTAAAPASHSTEPLSRKNKKNKSKT